MYGFIGFIIVMLLIIWNEKRVVKSKKPPTIAYEQRGKDWYYNIYLKSEHWKQRRLKALKQANYTCSCCGVNNNLQVHHLTYANVWNEQDEDLLVVCRSCHKRIHKKGAA